MSEPEFSRILRVDHLPRNGVIQAIEATPEERAALAKLNNLPEIAWLKARLDISKWRRGVRVVGEFSARLTQTCVVSLEPFEVEIAEPIDVKCLPTGGEPPSAEDEDEADPLVDGKVDLGALVAEFLTLALDPYPRKPGAGFAAPVAESEQLTPFDALRPLSRREEPD